MVKNMFSGQCHLFVSKQLSMWYIALACLVSLSQAWTGQLCHLAIEQWLSIVEQWWPIVANQDGTMAQYSDVRCKCVCPKGTLPKNVFVKFVKVEECKCEEVAKLAEIDCLRCQCKYEARNTTLIKAVVIFIIISLIILITYMIGVWIHSIWKPRGLSVTSDVIQERLLARSRTLSRLDSQVSRWKFSVGEQRRNVYNNHSILS